MDDATRQSEKSMIAYLGSGQPSEALRAIATILDGLHDHPDDIRELVVTEGFTLTLDMLGLARMIFTPPDSET